MFLIWYTFYVNTTYILHGGETSKDTPDNNLFFKYFTQFVEKDEVRILMCYFTKEKEIWDSRLESDRDKIARQTSKKIFLTLAEDPNDLINKLDDHDVLYVAGGNPEPLESNLSLFKEFKNKLAGKVYLGCSMGAFIVSSHYVLTFDPQQPSKVHHGLGLLPINTLCHFDIEEEKELKVSLLEKEAPQLPILTLNECKSVVFIH
jgi:peptidase E